MKSFKPDPAGADDIIDLAALPEDLRELLRQLLRQFAAGSLMGTDFPGAAEMSGLSRSWLYGAARRGELRVTKAGRKSLILVADLLDYLQHLPSATFKPEAGAEITDSDADDAALDPGAVSLADVKQQLAQLLQLIAAMEAKTAPPGT